jgi:antirestriction protein ArdC
LCAALGIVPTVRHADYLASWLAVLREDAAVRGTGGPRGRAIFRAASAASKAADWILARHAEPKPFRWIKSADDILSAVKRFRQKTEQALCTEL